jgi:hypothetical protein
MRFLELVAVTAVTKNAYRSVNTKILKKESLATLAFRQNEDTVACYATEDAVQIGNSVYYNFTRHHYN